ncbi:MAG TPA: SLC13 family permease, partial [Caldilineaceae bacterium]|nr:SLC13 family permease [Caldilineaceae bacterium]
MTPEMLFVFSVLGVTILLFLSDKLRLDLVAMLALLTLLLSGIITTDEALAGFSDPIVLIIAGLFVVGGALYQTGVAGLVGRWLYRAAGGNVTRLMILTVLAVGLLSGFLSSTGATAVLLPVVVMLARDAHTSPSKLLMPLAFGALAGGLLTLIGTPPNIVVSNVLRAQGLAPFGFFTFTPVGLAVLGLLIGFMLLIGRVLLPDRQPDGEESYGVLNDLAVDSDEMAAAYDLGESLFRLRVRRNSPMVGYCLEETSLGANYHVQVLEIQSWLDDLRQIQPPCPAHDRYRIQAHDVLHVQGRAADVMRLAREQELGVRPAEEEPGRPVSAELGLAEIMPTPGSQLLGQTLQELRFRSVYGVSVLGIKRMGKALSGDPATVKLEFGDTLLVTGVWADIIRLQKERRNLVVIGQPKEMADALLDTSKAPLAGLILAGMLVLMAFGLLPTVTAVLLAAVGMVLCGCLRPQEVYRTISWESLVLIAGMLPMSTALQKVGGVEFIADGLISVVGQMGPLAVLAGVFVITSLFSQFISNTATTVLVAPIAYTAALRMGVAPQAFLMAVAVAASSAFATPIAS